MLKKTIALLFATGLTLSSMAELPEINEKNTSSHTPSTLPVTVSSSNDEVYLDLDGNGDIDFFVWYQYYSNTSGSSSGYSKFFIEHNSSNGDGEVLVVPGSHDTKQAHDPEPCANLLVGTEIGPTAPLGLQWDSYHSLIMSKYNPSSYFSEFIDDDDEGYLGVRYSKGSGSQYGWLQLSVNTNNNSVTIMGKGVADDIDEPVMAGDAPLAPLSFLATFLGLGIIGIGAARRRKKN